MPTIDEMLLSAKARTNDAEIGRLANVLEFIVLRSFKAKFRSRRPGDKHDQLAEAYHLSARAIAEKIALMDAATPAGLLAKARAVKAWNVTTPKWQPGMIQPDTEKLLLRALLLDSIRVLGDDPAAAQVA